MAAVHGFGERCVRRVDSAQTARMSRRNGFASCRFLGTSPDFSMPLPIPAQIRIMGRPLVGGIHRLSLASVSKTLETEDFFMGPTNVALVKLFQADLQLRAAQARLE